jgi:nicotinate-nucleotide adenylyltransferase
VSPPIERIGFLGGMFDPVHNGHLQLARAARDYCGLGRVVLVPCGKPVHRAAPLASSAQRVAMLRDASKGCDWLHIDTRECDSPAHSYTVHTAAALRSACPDAALFLLLGLDAFLGFDKWLRWRELLELVHLCVAARAGTTLDEASLSAPLRAEFEARRVPNADTAARNDAGSIVFAEMDLPDIASTQVRDRVRAGGDISALVPAVVAARIAAEHLYQ